MARAIAGKAEVEFKAMDVSFIGNPRASNAGVEIKPPPPTVESINAAINPANNKKAIVLGSKISKIFPSPITKLKVYI